MTEIDVVNSKPFVKDLLEQVGKLDVSNVIRMDTEFVIIDNKPYRMVKIVFEE
jgi:hypothetical protein